MSDSDFASRAEILRSIYLKASEDEVYRQRLIADPSGMVMKACREQLSDFTAPDHWKINVVVEAENSMTLVLALSAEEELDVRELSIDELDMVAGGDNQLQNDHGDGNIEQQNQQVSESGDRTRRTNNKQSTR